MTLIEWAAAASSHIPNVAWPIHTDKHCRLIQCQQIVNRGRSLRSVSALLLFCTPSDVLVNLAAAAAAAVVLEGLLCGRWCDVSDVDRPTWRGMILTCRAASASSSGRVGRVNRIDIIHWSTTAVPHTSLLPAAARNRIDRSNFQQWRAEVNWKTRAFSKCELTPASVNLCPSLL